MTISKIEWTESTWNPVTGCTEISEGCRYCYAKRMTKRQVAMGREKYRNGFTVTSHEDTLDIPLRWRKPRLIFVNSMSDTFHKEVPDEFIHNVFQVMVKASQHQYQLLTKRADRLQQLAPSLPWPENVWMGVTVEDRNNVSRIDCLRTVPAAVRFLSIEPLLGPIPNLDLDGIDWVIVGGESGPGARAMKEEWVLDIRDQCLRSRVPFFFKQWGGNNKKKAGRLLEGRIWDEMPVVKRTRI